MRNVFLFDLDSTVTREEILPTIAKELGKGAGMNALTESTMMGEIPFEESFTARVDMLKDVSVSKMAKRVSNIFLNDKIVRFIRENISNCYIVTSNLDVWIAELMEVIKIHNSVFCSKAKVENDKIVGIDKILSKEEVIGNFQNCRTVAIGDGSNDYGLLNKSDIGIAFGGVRSVAPVLYEVCDYAVYDESSLCGLLNKIRSTE